MMIKYKTTKKPKQPTIEELENEYRKLSQTNKVKAQEMKQKKLEL